MPVEKKPSQVMQLALMRRDLDGILEHVKEIREDLKVNSLLREDMRLMKSEMLQVREFLKITVTQDQFWPVKTIVYGATSTMLLAILGAIIALVIARGSP
jgi:hypothetical protein